MSEGEALVNPNPDEGEEGRSARRGRTRRGQRGREMGRTVFLDGRETSHLSRELGNLVSIPKTTEAGEKDFPGEKDELSKGETDQLRDWNEDAREKNETHPLRRIAFRMPTLLTILEVSDHLHEVDDQRFGSSHCERRQKKRKSALVRTELLIDERLAQFLRQIIVSSRYLHNEVDHAQVERNLLSHTPEVDLVL